MSDRAAATELSIVVPVFNERANVAELVSRLDATLDGIRWEVIFVDDSSPDGTAHEVRRLARIDRRVRLISRHNRRGLSSAVVEGALAAAADVIAVMDGDLQHDETTLPRLYREVVEGRAELASASRFLDDDGAAGLSSERRLKISSTGIRLANRFFHLEMSDPLTGFFVMRRSVLDRALPNLSGIGFKILLDLVTAARPRPKVVEVPFTFRSRLHGESKLDNRVMYDFFLFFLEQKVGRFLPVSARFISFALINSVGILVHLAVLMASVNIGTSFAVAQLLATALSMFFNFSINNAVTYHDRRLRGSDFFTGFVVFSVLCSVGIFGNVGVATLLHKEFAAVWYVFPALAGALITVVWNYVATHAFVWGRQRLFASGRSAAERAGTAPAGAGPGTP